MHLHCAVLVGARAGLAVRSRRAGRQHVESERIVLRLVRESPRVPLLSLGLPAHHLHISRRRRQRPRGHLMHRHRRSAAQPAPPPVERQRRKWVERPRVQLDRHHAARVEHQHYYVHSRAGLDAHQLPDGLDHLVRERAGHAREHKSPRTRSSVHCSLVQSIRVHL